MLCCKALRHVCPWRRSCGRQGPLSRFGDTAANAGTLALLDSYEATKDLNVGLKTLCASTSAGLFRIALMPIDACKTILQACSRVGVTGFWGPTPMQCCAAGAAQADWDGRAQQRQRSPSCEPSVPETR